MSVIGLFFIFIASLAALWIWRQGLMQSSWLEEGEIVGYSAAGLPPPRSAKVGLVVFMAVAGCLFSLLAAAFFMRMDAPDWRSPPLPRILWLNTAMLIASSVALQIAQSAAKREEMERARHALLFGGASALLFLVGQLWAWRELVDGGFYASENPANAFFFLLTGFHALHLIGGLLVLGRIIGGASAREDDPSLANGAELCAIYWHFLLFVWGVQLALLTGWANNFGVICRRLLS